MRITRLTSQFRRLHPHADGATHELRCAGPGAVLCDGTDWTISSFNPITGHGKSSTSVTSTSLATPILTIERCWPD